ncbi:MAG: hypothetical protein VKN72_00980 [Nostocales cyanobacterium 94392]|nr:hypothetical protein [Nostocales cyanobacterium 94392]
MVLYYEAIYMQIKDLTTDELKTLIRETVVEVLEDFLPDPDEGITVKEEFKQLQHDILLMIYLGQL